MLISTKIHPPQLKSNLMNRNHLIDRFTAGSRSRFILITAPAGYGKTSLVGQWINHDKPKVAWFSIDDSDNDFDTFFRYLLAALIKADKRFDKFFRPLHNGRLRLSEDDVIPAIIQALHTISSDFYVILDDYHLISAVGVHHALARMMKYLPPMVHVVIISRYSLPQSLSKLRFQYDTTEITPDDLKFSEDEAKHFFKKVIPLDLTQDQIRELARIADGWVAGFQIFGLSQLGKRLAKEPESIAKAAGREVIDYLINEVVMAQDEKVRTFLFNTSVLNRLNADICGHVTGFSDAGKILTDLYRMNLFMAPLDPCHVWFRYHHLFSEALRQWVEISSPDLLTKTRKKAAMWCAEKKYTEEAFQYALASGDFEFLADILEDHLVNLFERFEFASSLRWMAKLPHDLFLKRPLLRLFDCEFKIYKNQFVEVQGILSEIESQLDGMNEQYDKVKITFCKDLLVCMKTILHCFKKPMEVDIKKATEQIGKISSENRPFSGWLRMFCVVMPYINQGDIISAEKHMKMASADILPYEMVRIRTSWALRMSILYRCSGRLRQSENFIVDAFKYLEQRKLADNPVKYWLYYPMAWIHYQRNELDMALECAMHSLKYAEITGWHDPLIERYYLLSVIWMGKGDLKIALNYANKAKSLVEGYDFLDMVDSTEDLFFNISLLSSNTGVAKHRLSMGKPDMSKPFYLHLVTETILFAVSLLVEGQVPEACRLLEALRKRCEKRSLLEMVLMIDIFLSGVYWLMEEKESARKTLKHAIIFSEKEGYIRPYVNYALLVFPVLQDLNLSSNDISRMPHFKKVYNACEISGKDEVVIPEAPQKENTFDLTRRELEILKLVSHGYRNKQIADKTFVSISTVKTHVRHILKKLEVDNRMQAVIKAEKLFQFRSDR